MASNFKELPGLLKQTQSCSGVCFEKQAGNLCIKFLWLKYGARCRFTLLIGRCYIMTQPSKQHGTPKLVTPLLGLIDRSIIGPAALSQNI